MEIERKIDQSIEKIFSLQIEQSLEFSNEDHHLSGRELKISKGNNCYNFDGSSPIIAGVQTHKELDFDRSIEYEFSSDSGNYFVSGRDIYLNNIAYSEDNLKILSGSIYSLSNTKSINKNEGLFRRFILPLGNEKINLSDFQKFPVTFSSNGRKSRAFYLLIDVKGIKYYIYQRKFKNENYLFIDSGAKLSEKEFQKICFNIMLTFAFVKGNLHHDQSYILGFETEEMEVVDEISYYSMRVSAITNQPTFTTNIYSIYKDEFENLNETEEKALKEKLYEDIYDFDATTFSKLVELFNDEEKAQRAVILFIHGHHSSLEIRLPNYYVALEAITSLISNKFKSTKERLNPIKDNDIANEIISMTIDNIEKYIKDKNIAKEDINLEIIKRKLDSLNTPPNADKLAEPFNRVGYKLNEEQLKILKKRNSYLHGSFVKYVDEDKVFKEALYVSLRVHFLIAVLILKMTEFEGKIINYSSLWKYMTEKEIIEDRLVKI
ncbi:hypothetical protein ERX46_09880 [Brumimicrobium glaciale]|uniref:ApeA N-terminal domain-containing protein n=1 Tax=Brumimicrobium glaciale TaxID=200475 RepID=A0A4V1WFH8_9FLAO|nr:hypothetical protein [Brumimicrobium glaciale]RYM33246.1 hypothetical protein ERX46_09880 [Brumimicrobium glaciale]